MGLIELLLKRKKETEDAANADSPNTGMKDDLQAQLEQAEKARDKRYVQKDKPKEEQK